MKKKPYPHFETEEQELAWLSAAGTKSAEYMGEPTEEAQREFAQFLTERPDEETTRKPVTVRMKLRDLARLKGLARKLDTKYQTLMLELIAEGLERREAALRQAKETADAHTPAQGGNVIEMAEHLSATRTIIDMLLEAQGSRLSELMAAPPTPRKRKA